MGRFYFLFHPIQAYRTTREIIGMILAMRGADEIARVVDASNQQVKDIGAAVRGEKPNA